jgi:hypothetical protein
MSQAHLDPAVSGQMATTLVYDSGQLAALVATTHAHGSQKATIITDAGWIRIHRAGGLPKRSR